MKKALLASVVKKHGDKLQQCAKQLPGAFAQEDIHDLRVEYKRLRAFIRLAQSSPDTKEAIHVPRSLKNLYRAAGAVRDWQLFIEQVTLAANNRATTLPVFSKSLQQRLFHAKETLVKAWEDSRPRKTIGHLKKELPARLKRNAIEAFLHRKIASIHIILLVLDQDQELHSIRKQLKDILLNVRLFNKHWDMPFPVTAWNNIQQLEQTAEALGEYNDICNTLSLLAKDETTVLPAEEKAFLQQWTEELVREKARRRAGVVQSVHQLQLVSNFEALRETANNN